MLLRVYRLNDIMIHDNDNCTDARGTATILNCNIRKWRLNATALSLRREFFTKVPFKFKNTIARVVYI